MIVVKIIIIIIITVIITLKVIFSNSKLETTKGGRYYTQKWMCLRLDCACLIEISVLASGESTGPGGLGWSPGPRYSWDFFPQFQSVTVFYRRPDSLGTVSRIFPPLYVSCLPCLPCPVKFITLGLSCGLFIHCEYVIPL